MKQKKIITFLFIISIFTSFSSLALVSGVVSDPDYIYLDSISFDHTRGDELIQWTVVGDFNYQTTPYTYGIYTYELYMFYGLDYLYRPTDAYFYPDNQYIAAYLEYGIELQLNILKR